MRKTFNYTEKANLTRVYPRRFINKCHHGLLAFKYVG